jgi:hypothetical protein
VVAHVEDVGRNLTAEVLNGRSDLRSPRHIAALAMVASGRGGAR